MSDNNILNCPEGINLWNRGQFHHLHAGAILKKLENKSTSHNSIMLSENEIERLKAEREFQRERFQDKYGR